MVNSTETLTVCFRQVLPGSYLVQWVMNNKYDGTQIGTDLRQPILISEFPFAQLACEMAFHFVVFTDGPRSIVLQYIVTDRTGSGHYNHICELVERVAR